LDKIKAQHNTADSSRSITASFDKLPLSPRDPKILTPITHPVKRFLKLSKKDMGEAIDLFFGYKHDIQRYEPITCCNLCIY
jgi:hypothetical protein